MAYLCLGGGGGGGRDTVGVFTPVVSIVISTLFPMDCESLPHLENTVFSGGKYSALTGIRSQKGH